MSALDLTTFDAALKNRYTDQNIRNLTYKDHPFLAMVPKMTNFGGKGSASLGGLAIPLIWGNPLGRSHSFTQAQAAKAPGKYAAFILTRVNDYGLASIDNETLRASEGDPNSFLRAAVVEVDGMLQAVTNSLARALYRTGTGSIGQLGTGVTTGTTVTLLNVEDVVNFEVGQTLVASASDGGALRNTTGIVVTAVNRETGVLTAATAWDGAGTITASASDFLYVKGDAQAGASALSKVAGLAAWIPASAPSATAFFGVNRSQDPTRLGGIRYDATTNSETIEEALIGASARAYREGARPDIVLMNPTDYASLTRSLGNKVILDVAKSADGKMGFDAIVLMGASGKMKVIADPDCQKNIAWMLRLDTWKLYSLGEAPHIITAGDGLRFLRESAADAIEMRCGYYANLGCNAPGFNVRIKLA